MLYLAFLKDNEIVFLDEPFDGLDKDILKRVINYINDNSEVTYVISSHNKKVFELLEEKEVISFD